MLPITRANLDNICCTCLMDVRPTNPASKKVYVINEDTNLLKVLQGTAYVTVLKDPKNLKFIDNYSRKLCQKCFSKAQDSYQFLEKIRESTARLKDVLVSGLNTTGIDVKKLKYCCRICLKRQRGQRNEYYKKYLKWLQDFSGMEGEEQLNNNQQFSKHLCGICLKKLQTAEIYLLLSTFSFEYIASEIGKNCEIKVDSKDIGGNKLPQKELMIVNEISSPQNFNKGVKEEVFMIKYEEEGTQYQETVILNNKAFETNNLPEDSNKQKHGKNHFTDSPVYSTAVEEFSTDENHFSVKQEEYEDNIDYDFVVIDAEE